ncbi:MAG TPA: ERF family protein [Gemmata sp.]|nr:ERF family protein [Gemmata sp.]
MNAQTKPHMEMDEIVDMPEANPLVLREPKNPHMIGTQPTVPVLPTTSFANIATAISSVMAEIGVVGEGGENKFQNYKYMSYKDMFRKLTPLMGKHGIAVIPTEKSKSLFDNDAVVMGTYQFTIIHKSGEVWPFQPEWTGVSRARDSKGGFDDKALNKCATAAQKYFLKALFQIPSGDDDEDPDNHDGIVQGRDNAPPRRQSPPQQTRPPVQQTEPIVQQSTEKGPRQISGGSYKSWTDEFIRLVGMASDPAEVMAWIDKNRTMLEKLAKGSEEEAQRARDFVARQLEFLRRTAPQTAVKPETMETHSIDGDDPPAKPKKGTVPDIKKDYDSWVAFVLQRFASMEVAEEIDTFFLHIVDAEWSDLQQPDKEAIQGAMRDAQARLET